MNYLAHLHIAAHTQTSSLGNFLGDFVKGDPDQRFNIDTVQGIRLHRFVDSYTDSHPLVLSVKPLFPQPLRRFSPIALDMFWDHCLAKYWADFHPRSLSDFCLQAQREIAKQSNKESNALPERFVSVSDLVWQGRWFEHYADFENINYALQRIAERRPRLAPLADTFATLELHYDQLMAIFWQLYPIILDAVIAETKKETT